MRRSELTAVPQAGTAGTGQADSFLPLGTWPYSMLDIQYAVLETTAVKGRHGKRYSMPDSPKRQRFLYYPHITVLLPRILCSVFQLDDDTIF